MAPASQDNVEVMTAGEADVVAGLCNLWSKVVYDILMLSEVAPEPANNPLAELEAVLKDAVLLDPTANLPEEARVPAPECQEHARVALEVMPEQQVVVREQDIEDSEPLRSAAIETRAGSSSRATDEDLSLLEDELLDDQYVELQVEGARWRPERGE